METRFSLEDIESFEYIELDYVYDLTVLNTSCYYLDNDILVHNSGKSYDLMTFLIYYCQVNEQTPKDILIFRQTYSDLKKSILKDFLKMLKHYGLYKDKNHVKSAPQSYKLYNSIIYFSGLDGMGSHGERHDVIWGNEAMELDFESFKQLNQRCNEVFFLDYNPCYTDHWIYSNILNRPDTKFKHSTLLENSFLPEGQRSEIMSYKPTKENIVNGTADDNMWNIYGLGLRTAVTGLIFNHIKWVDEMPRGNYHYGLDYGFTNDPSALTKSLIDGNNWYLELLCYEPIDNSSAINDMLYNCGIKKYELITCDSMDRHNDNNMTIELRNMGWNVKKVNKGKGIVWRIGLMKKYKIHIVMNKLANHAKKESENYKWRTINGISINEPLDKYNHFWDSAGYNLIGQLDDYPRMVY
jgi:PBSX family phage terminase large subunit